MTQRRYKLSGSWRLILRDLGFDEVTLCRLSEVREDLWRQEIATVTADEWFALWRGLELLIETEEGPLMLGQAIDAEGFDPPMFAALCSPNMTVAAQRLSYYKALIAPMKLDIEESRHGLIMELRPPPERTALPLFLGRTELVFFVALMRNATRHRAIPLRVTSPQPFVTARQAFEDWFGCPVTEAPTWSVTFSPEDARRPFLTVNHQMFEFFEPGLRSRLSEVEAMASTAERVGASLRELLPAGRSTIDDVARALGTSRRSLQRALREESTNFRQILSETRERLARHYLSNSEMNSAEISFLLGYDNPNSFFRAFRAWTGTTPESLRT